LISIIREGNSGSVVHIAVAMGTGRAAEYPRFGELKAFIEKRIRQEEEEEEVKKLEEKLVKREECALSLRAIDLETLPAVVMEGF
jgi:hypothetical protein